MGHNRAWRTLQGAEIAAGGLADQEANRFNELARAYDVMQIRSFRGSGKPARVIALQVHVNDWDQIRAEH